VQTSALGRRSVERPLDEEDLESEVHEEENEEREREGGGVRRPCPLEEDHQPRHHQESGDHSRGDRRQGLIRALPQCPLHDEITHREVHEPESRPDDGSPHPFLIQLDGGDQDDQEENDEGARQDQPRRGGVRRSFLCRLYDPRTW
jgi:hypothetical protein